MFKYFLTLLLLSSSNTLFAAEKCSSVVKIDNRDISGLENYVKDNNFESIECFLASLPKDIRAFRTYFKKSLSLQDGSPTNPRALVGSPDGGFFMTFNGHPRQRGYNEIEVIALDKSKGPTQWVTAVIKQKKGHLSFQKNVKKCSACHGSPIRPIWGIYPDWPNSFGSIDDWLPDPNNLGKDSHFYQQDIAGNDYYGSKAKDKSPRLSKEKIAMALKESQQFRTFRKKAKQHPRYSVLEEASDNKSPVYPYTEVYRIRNNAFRPNLTIGSVITMRHNEILLRRIIKNPVYQSHKSSILHYDTCSGDDEATKHNQKIHNFIYAGYEKKYQRQLPKPLYDSNFSYTQYFLDLLGLKPHEKTLLLANDTHFLPDEDSSYFSGYFSISGDINQKLLSLHLGTWPDKEKFLRDSASFGDPYENLEEIKAHSSYFSYFQSDFLGRDMYMMLNQAYGSRNIIGQNVKGENLGENLVKAKRIYFEMCRILKKESEEELKQPVDPSLFSFKPKPHTPWPKALNTCIECHDSGNNISVSIPFKDPKKLDQSGFDAETLSSVIESITKKDMIPAHRNGIRMPLGHAPLTEKEKKEILNWINQNQ